MAGVLFLIVLLTGTAVNVEKSGDPLNSIGEAYHRTVDAIKEGNANTPRITQSEYAKEYNQ